MIPMEKTVSIRLFFIFNLILSPTLTTPFQMVKNQRFVGSEKLISLFYELFL